MIASSSVVSSGGTFSVCMHNDAVQIVSVPSDSVPHCAWWIIREYCLNWELKPFFNALIYDDDGLSFITTPASLTALRGLNIDNLKISPQKWISLHINVSGSASELPGVVFYLANALTKSGLSILHMSTFDSEVFLVQEQDVEVACDILRQLSDMHINQYSNIISEEKKVQLSDNSGPEAMFRSPPNLKLPRSPSEAVPLNGFVLCKLPRHLALAKLNSEFLPQQCADVMMKLLLYDPRYSTTEKAQRKAASVSTSSSFNGNTGFHHHDSSGIRSLSRVGSGVSTVSTITSPFNGLKPPRQWGDGRSEHSSGTSSLDPSPRHSRATSGVATCTNGLGNGSTPFINRMSDMNTSIPVSDDIDIKLGTFMMGFWQREDELTFLIDEEDLDMFPEGALDVSPQRWRVIKLCGRAIEFDETGIVSAMSRIESTVQCLNISTATTNCTLVPEELLDSTAEALSDALQCPIQDAAHVESAYQH